MKMPQSGFSLSTKRHQLTFAACLIAAGLSSQALGETYYFDQDTLTSNGITNGSGTSFVWKSTLKVFYNVTTGTDVAYYPTTVGGSDNVIFGGDATHPAGGTAALVSSNESNLTFYMANLTFNGPDTGTAWGIKAPSNAFNISSAFTVNGGLLAISSPNVTGAATVTINSGTLTSFSTAGYTGPSILNGGTVTTITLKNGGVTSGIGASTADASNLVFNGGTLSFSGSAANGITNRQFTLGANGGLITTAANPVTFNATGSVAFAGTGHRTLSLAGSATTTTGSVLAAALGDQDSTTGRTSIVKNGTGRWTLSGTNTYSGPTSITGGNLVITGNYTPASLAAASVTMSGATTTLTVNGGTATFAGVRGGNVAVSNSGRLTVAASDADGAGPLVQGSADAVVKVNGLSIDATSKFDLKNNGLIIPATGSLNGSTITVDTLRAAIIAGRGGVGTGAATWSGAGGIGTSSYTLDETIDSIGYSWTGDPNILTAPTNVNGETYAPGDYVVKYCAAADADLNGLVDDTDVAVIGLTYDSGATTGHHWYEGDFNYDGLINDDDIAIIGLAYAPSNAPLSPSFYAALSADYGANFASAFAAGASGTVVPEPTLATVCFGGLLLLKRRRR